MVTWGEIKTWTPAPLQAAVDQLNKAYNKTVAVSDDLSDLAEPAGWVGDAANAARGRVTQMVEGLEEHAAELAAGRRAAAEVGDAITGVQNGVTEVETIAAAHRFSIGDDGSVVDHGMGEGVPDDQQMAVSAERKTVSAELVDRVAEVIRTAEDVDDDFCTVLDRILSGHTIETANGDTNTTLAAAAQAGDALGMLSVPDPPPAGATAAQNAAYWATLSERERTELASAHPELVGNRDGFSAKQRDMANRILLERDKTQLQAALAQAKANNPGWKDMLGLENSDIGEIQAKLDSITQIEQLLNLPDRHLLQLDMSQTRAEAAIANGNVDNATDVAVFTPGLTSTVDGSMSEYDQNLNDLKLKTESILKTTDPSATVATVTWLGYQAPQLSVASIFGANSVAAPGAAQDGGKSLSSFLTGVTETRMTNPTNLTALGHSYGSLTTGYALQTAQGVNNAVVFGSPGLGTSHLADLKVPAGHMFDIKADGDPVAAIGYSSHFGENPAALQGMGDVESRGVDAAHSPTGQALAGVTGHTNYFTNNSTSQYNMAAVVAGHPESTIAGTDNSVLDNIGQTGRQIAHDAWEVITLGQG